MSGINKRPFTVGRKNWLFSDSPQGAEASATAYSIVEMAKANNLNISKHFTYILEQRSDNNWSDEQLETIAPWNEAVIGVCKIIRVKCSHSSKPLPGCEIFRKDA